MTRFGKVGGIVNYTEKRSPRDVWIDHLWIDLAVVGLVAAAHAGAIYLWPFVDVLGNAQPADRHSVYGATAVVVSLLGSFSAVAIGQLSAAKRARADSLRAQGASMLARNWRSIFRAAMLAALASIIALLLDPSTHTTAVVPVVARWLFEVAVLLAVVKFIRLSSLFVEVLTIAAMSGEDESDERVDAPTFNVDWAKQKRAS